MKSMWYTLPMLILSGLPQSVQWTPDFNEGMRRSRESGRPVLVDFWSPYCFPCGQMDKNVYADSRIVEALQGFIMIRINTDADTATPARFNVTRVPTRIFLSPDETVLSSGGGFTEAGEFLDIIKTVPKNFEPIKTVPSRGREEEAVTPPPMMVEPVTGPLSRAVLGATDGAPARPASIVDLSRDELLRLYSRELADVDMDQKEGAADLMDRVGKSAKEFLENLPNTASRERIRQERLWHDGRVVERVEQNLDYLLLLNAREKGFEWEEARTDKRGKPAKIERLDGISFVTSGYALECVMLTATQQKASRFRYLGKQSTHPFAHVVGFAQKPESDAIPGVFRMNGQKLQFLSQGIVWVDPTSYQILKIRTDLLEPLSDAGLTRQTTEISYAEYRFSSGSRPFWLPREVVVTIKFNGITFRNTHRYSDYKLFSVESYEKREPVLGTRPIK